MDEDLATWILPFTFLPAVGLLILSTANRFHHVNELIRGRGRERGDHAYLCMLLRRSRYFHRALTALYLAMGAFAVAALLGNVNQSWLGGREPVQLAAGLLTTVGVGSVVYGAWLLILESALSFRMIRMHESIADEDCD